MEIKRVTVSGIDGNNGREYRVHYLDGQWLLFNSMPGDKQLYNSHKSSSCGLPDAPISLPIDQHTKQARQLLVADFVGKYDKPMTIYFATKMRVMGSTLNLEVPATTPTHNTGRMASREFLRKGNQLYSEMLRFINKQLTDGLIASSTLDSTIGYAVLAEIEAQDVYRDLLAIGVNQEDIIGAINASNYGYFIPDEVNYAK